MVEKCFKHPRRKAVFKWRICADGRWHGVCKKCDVELNELGLKWAYPRTWKPKLEEYKKEIGA